MTDKKDREEETATAEEEKTITMIPFTNLRPSPYNTYEITDIDDLKQSIKTYGLLTALTVIGPSEDGTYEILAGERRYTAIRALREEGNDIYDQVPCYVIGDAHVKKTVRQLLVEVSNQDVRRQDKADVQRHRFNTVRLVKELADEGVFDHKEMVAEARKYMKMSDRYRRIYFQIFDDGTKSLNEFVENGKLAPTDAAKISRLDPDMQDQVVRELSQAKSPSEKRDIMDKYRDDYTVKSKVEESSDSLNSNSEKADIDNFDEYDAFIEEYGDFADNSGASYHDDDFDDDYDELEDYDQFMEEFGDIGDRTYDIDTTGRRREMRADEMREFQAKKEATEETVTEWLDQLLRKDTPDSREWDLIEVMRQIIDKFCILR